MSDVTTDVSPMGDPQGICPNGHPVPAGQIFCGVCGQRAANSSTDAPDADPGQPGVPWVKRHWLVTAAAVAIVIALAMGGLLASRHRASTTGDGGARATGQAGPSTAVEKCEQAVLEIVAAGLEDQVQGGGGSNSALSQEVFKYGTQSPYVAFAESPILTDAGLALIHYGIHAGTVVARKEAAMGCESNPQYPALGFAVAQQGQSSTPSSSPGTDPAPPTASPASTTPTETPTTMPHQASPGEVDCSSLNEVQCQQEALLARRCETSTMTIALNRDVAPGLTMFTYGLDAHTAYASGDVHTGAFVESCGEPSNGIDVVAMHKAIADGSGLASQGIDAVECLAKTRPLDEMSIGSAVECDLYVRGVRYQTKVTVTRNAPHYLIGYDFD